MASSNAIKLYCALFAFMLILNSAYAQPPNYATFQSWLPIVFLAMLASVSMISVHYAVGFVFQNNKVKETARNELMRAFGTGILIVIILWLLNFVGSLQFSVSSISNVCSQLGSSQLDIVNSQYSLSAGDLFDSPTYTICNNIIQPIATGNTGGDITPNLDYGLAASEVVVANLTSQAASSLNGLYLYEGWINFLNQMSDTVTVCAGAEGCIYTYAAATYFSLSTPYFAGYSALEQISPGLITAYTLSFYLFVLEMDFINIFLYSWPYLLAAGLILSSFFLTRRIGGLLIAIAIVALIVFPSLFLFEYSSLSSGTPLSPIGASSSGNILTSPEFAPVNGGPPCSVVSTATYVLNIPVLPLYQLPAGGVCQSAGISTPSISPLNPTIDSGQGVSFSSTWSGGTPPYTASLYSSSTSTCDSGSSLVAQKQDIPGGGVVFDAVYPTSNPTWLCVVVTDSAGNSAVSAASEVAVNTNLMAGEITSISQSVSIGKSVTLNANPSGGEQPLHIAWYQTTDTATSAEQCGTGAWTPISGASSYTYSASPTENTWYCYVVTDSASTPESAQSASDLITISSQSSSSSLTAPPPTYVNPSTSQATFGESGQICNQQQGSPSPGGSSQPSGGSTSGLVSFKVSYCYAFTANPSGGTTPYTYSWYYSPNPATSSTCSSGTPGIGNKYYFALSGAGQLSQPEYVCYCVTDSETPSVQACSASTGVNVNAASSSSIFPLSVSLTADAGGTTYQSAYPYTVITLTPGQSVTFTATASGGSAPYSYAWYSEPQTQTCTSYGCSSLSYTQVQGYSSPSETFTPTALTKYYVSVSDSSGASVQSAVFWAEGNYASVPQAQTQAAAPVAYQYALNSYGINVFVFPNTTQIANFYGCMPNALNGQTPLLWPQELATATELLIPIIGVGLGAVLAPCSNVANAVSTTIAFADAYGIMSLAGFVLPLINLMIAVSAVKGLSGLMGGETTLVGLERLI